ncbi:MAG: TrkH family potassium uptake protein [Candidatus Altiarchaeota archaeon]
MSSVFFSIGLDDIKISLRDLAAIIQMLSIVMLFPLVATIAYSSQVSLLGRIGEASAFILPSLILYSFYKTLNMFRVETRTKTKHIMITVGLAWIIMSLVGSIPFMMRGTLGPLDSFFESMSGWTTTGFSMIEDFEGTDRDILMYRGIMQATGGLGVISLGMMVLLQGSSPGIGYADIGIQKIKPGIKSTIVETWKIYGLYILMGIVLLNIAGMDLFDAVNHSFTAMATGGFSTHSSIGYYDNALIEIVLIFLMIVGMTSFILHYRLFNGDRNVFKSAEVRYGFGMIAIAILAFSAVIWGTPVEGVDTNSVFDVIRQSSFQVIAGASTCGYNTVDFGKWPDFAKTFMIGLMYVGGMSSSTAGGIRIVRFIIILKAIHYSLKKLVLPKSALIIMKVDKKAVQEDIITVVGYCGVYLSICVILSLSLMLVGYRSVDSIFTIMSAMGNDGLNVFSGGDWYHMNPIGKLTIILGMWIGRVEIYPGLLILRSFMIRLRLL